MNMNSLKTKLFLRKVRLVLSCTITEYSKIYDTWFHLHLVSDFYLNVPIILSEYIYLSLSFIFHPVLKIE